jgi:hypothetical protein
VLTGTSLTARGDLQTTTTQVVGAGTPANSDGFYVTQTSVDPVDSVKSSLKYDTVVTYSQLNTRGNKSGLLGSTTTSDLIVPPSTQPAELSQTVIESSVEAISPTKSRRIITSSNGPTLLGGASTKSGLLGNTTIKESIVAYGTSPDAVSSSVISSEVTPIDSAKSKKTTTSSDGPTSLGGKSVNKYGTTETITKSIVAPSQAVDLTGLLVSDEIDPIDSAKSQRQRVVMDSTPPDVITYEISHDTATIKNTTSMILRSDLTAPSITGAILDVADVDVGFPWIKRTIKSLLLDGNGDPILPPSRVEYRSIQHTFPGIIYTWKAKHTDDGLTASLSFFDNRYPVSMTVASRSVITYHVGEQDLSNEEFFSVTTRPWAIQFFNIPDGTIHPPAPVNLSTASISNNGIALQIAGGQASNPTTYNIGDEILIGGDCERWQGNIFIKRLEYVKEPV